jgi:peptidoglycan/xylan/chitin deacetylase (PgdA/CDA1 family)
MKNNVKIIILLIICVIVSALGIAVFTIFFDEAIIVRKGTVYHGPVSAKVVALTFDDGPSPVWTPQIRF